MKPRWRVRAQRKPGDWSPIFGPFIHGWEVISPRGTVMFSTGSARGAQTVAYAMASIDAMFERLAQMVPTYAALDAFRSGGQTYDTPPRPRLSVVEGSTS